MLQTIEAVIDEKGILRILEAIELPRMRRVIVTILNEEPTQETLNKALLNREIVMLEQQHARGYAKRPSKKEEFTEWESEQAWEELSVVHEKIA